MMSPIDSIPSLHVIAGAQMFMAGFLPFSAIYIELFYIFASVWGHKVRRPSAL